MAERWELTYFLSSSTACGDGGYNVVVVER